MTLHSWGWYYLVIAPHLLLLPLLAVFIRRKLYRQFPMFLIYVAAETIQFAILFPMLLMPSVSAETYAEGFSIGLAFSTAMRFGIIHEIFAHTFRNYAAINRLGRPLFWWAAFGLLLAGLVLAAFQRGHDALWFLSILNVLDRAASILQCGLLVVLFVFSSYLGISWRSHLFGITLGLGVFASVELIASAIRSETGYIYNNYLNYFTMATYHWCVLIWAFYLWAPERSAQLAVKTMPQHDLETWNRELQDLLRLRQ